MSSPVRLALFGQSKHDKRWTGWWRRHGRSLELQLEAAAGGRFEGLLGVVAEVEVAP